MGFISQMSGWKMIFGIPDVFSWPYTSSIFSNIQGYHDNDFSGTPLIIRAVGNIRWKNVFFYLWFCIFFLSRHVDLIDAEFNYFNNNLESYECRCWNDGHKISFQTCDWLVSIFPGLSLVETKTVPIPRSKNWLLLTCILR